jgi:hypothetical protein
LLREIEVQEPNREPTAAWDEEKESKIQEPQTMTHGKRRKEAAEKSTTAERDPGHFSSYCA